MRPVVFHRVGKFSGTGRGLAGNMELERLGKGTFDNERCFKEHRDTRTLCNGECRKKWCVKVRRIDK